MSKIQPINDRILLFFLILKNDVERMFVSNNYIYVAICLGNLCIIEKKKNMHLKTDV
jgi:hypothetical protein